MFGFINIYKPVGMTSHDVIGNLRRITKIKQIGHTGTLDPFAEGVLPIAIGKATRLIEYLSDDKAYIGRFCFGKSTDTYDIEGNIIKEYKDRVSEKDVIKYLPKGNIEQFPPIYSAKKINGKKMYELARAGIKAEDIEIKPSKVHIYESKVIEFNEKEQWADIYIKCSKGTYIRSIANDLGKSLNNGCFLSKLKRVQSGLFDINQTCMLEDLKSVSDVERNMLNPTDYLYQIKRELNEKEYNRISHGMCLYSNGAKDGEFVLLIKNNNLVAVAQVEGEILKPKKVMI